MHHDQVPSDDRAHPRAVRDFGLPFTSRARPRAATGACAGMQRGDERTHRLEANAEFEQRRSTVYTPPCDRYLPSHLMQTAA